MAEPTQPASSWDRRDILRLKRRVYLRLFRGKVIAQSWPKPTGKPKSIYQQAWVDWFRAAARGSKNPLPDQLEFAQQLVKGTGWYYRDLLERAAAGKLFVYGDQVKMSVPTADLYGTADQAMPNGTYATLEADAWHFDTNSWRDAAHPDALTCQTSGLYLVTLDVSWTTISSTGVRAIRILKNGTTIAMRDLRGAIANFAMEQSLVLLIFLERGDWLQAQAFCNTSSQRAQLLHLAIIGITPELAGT